MKICGACIMNIFNCPSNVDIIIRISYIQFQLSNYTNSEYHKHGHVTYVKTYVINTNEKHGIVSC